jgi:hypothetical protein
LAKVIRLRSGGSSIVEDDELSFEQAKALAAHLASVGEPPGCCWCVAMDEGPDEDEEEADGQTRAR